MFILAEDLLVPSFLKEEQTNEMHKLIFH